MAATLRQLDELKQKEAEKAKQIASRGGGLEEEEIIDAEFTAIETPDVRAPKSTDKVREGDADLSGGLQ